MSSFLRIITSLFSFGRGLFAFLFFFLFAYAIFKSSLKDKMAIVEIATGTVLYPAQLLVHQATSWSVLEKENAQLKQQNAKLRVDVDLLRQLLLREERLAKIQGTVNIWSDSLRLVEVVATNPGRRVLSLVVGAGDQELLSKGMPAITSKGLVGRISKVHGGHSIVQLLLDPLSRVSVLENRTRISGILEAASDQVLQVDFPDHAQIRIGDTLVTSGYGGVFPKGILVGTIHKLGPGELAVMKRAEVRLFQNPHEVEEMFIMMHKPDWRVLEEEQP